MDCLNRYVSWMKARRPDFGGLRFAVDCSNGMASILVHELFPEAVIINDTLDGTFPNHSPNPLKAEAREQIAALVREKGFDCGVIFDGDADRCMFVDERGEFVQPDYLIPVVARATLSSSHLLTLSPSHPLKIIHDVRTSRGAIEELKRMGCEPVMVPVGHAFAKPILREIGAVCGGELAGHYYFSEFHGCDSGVLAALRILGEVAKAKAEGREPETVSIPLHLGGSLGALKLTKGSDIKELFFVMNLTKSYFISAFCFFSVRNEFNVRTFGFGDGSCFDGAFFVGTVDELPVFW